MTDYWKIYLCWIIVVGFTTLSVLSILKLVG